MLKMKKASSIYLVFITLIISLNLGVVSHYCGGQLAESRLVYGNGTAGCGMNCTDTEPGNNPFKKVFIPASCCSDSFTDISSDEYHPVTVSNSFTGQLSTPSTINRTPLLPVVYKSLLISQRPPPFLTEVSLPFIQVFII
jgi:hypothetical protein